MQSMWSNTLDSDMVKGFVSLGTEIVKIIDKIGLLNTALIALATYSMVKNKMGPIAFLGSISDLIRDVIGKVGGFIGSLTGMTAATSAYTAETLAASVANGTLSASEAASIATKNGLTLATTSLTAAEATEMLMKSGVAKADALAMVAKIGLTSSTQALSLADIQAAVSSGALTTAQGAQIASALGLTVANKGLTASLMGLWTALWPILAVMAGVAVIWGIVKGIDALITTTEELSEDLSNLKSELSDIESEIDTLNSELEITQDRMAELLSLPSLSFTEQKELEALQKQNEELERRERLLKAQEEREKKRVAEKAVETANSQLSETSYNGNFWTGAGSILTGAGGGAAVGAGIGAALSLLAGPFAAMVAPATAGLGAAIGGAIGGVAMGITEFTANRISTEEKLNEEIEGYQSLIDKRIQLEGELEGLSDEEYEKKKEEISKINEEISEKDAYIDDTLSELKTTLDGVEYGQGADETLDKYYNLVYKREISAGTLGAESDGLAHIFSRPEHEAAKEGIDNYIASLAEGAEKSREEIEKIITDNDALVADIKAMGLEISDAVDYFTMDGSSYGDDIMTQYGAAVTALENLKSGAINLDDLVEYDEESGEATGRVDAIAEQLNGVAPEVREQFASIVEAIKEGSYDTEEGLVNWDSAIKKMELQGMQAVIANVKTELEAANKLAFPDLEVSGWIDSIEELSGAFDSLASAMDLIVIAQEQMDNSGRISMKTALDLMATTDNWNEILEVNNGVITMNANAEQILIQSKLDLIKANIEMALQQVETDIALMEGAINSTKAGNAFTQGFTKALTNAQGVLVGLKAGWDAFWAGEDVASAFNGAYSKTVDNLTPDESSLGDLYTQRANLLKQKEMLTGVDTTQEFKNNYDFDKTPGDKYGTDKNSQLEEDMDWFQKEMDYWENRIGANQAKYEQLQNEIDLLEAKGQKANTEYYTEQIKLEQQRRDLLQQQKEQAEGFLAQLEEGGLEGSEEWWEVANTLNDIESELDDVTASIVDLQDAIGEIDAYKFEELNTRLDNLTSKLGTIRDLIAPNGEEDWFDAEGQWTESGVAVLGAHIQELEFDKEGLKKAQDELNKYSFSYGGNEAYYEALGIHSEQEYYDKVEELTEQQYQYLESINDTEQSIVDMYESNIDAVEEYTETLIDSYNDYIDSVKEALSAERD